MGAWGREKPAGRKQDHWPPHCPGVDGEGRAQNGSQAAITQSQRSQRGWQPAAPANTEQPGAPSPAPSQRRLLAGAAVRFPVQP